MATTVIIGGGIIGLSTAHYLSEHQPGSTIHIVDSSSQLFASASGYAGGFLAKDWYSSASKSLGELSFSEHKRLAEENDGRATWGYARSKTVSYEQQATGKGDSGDGPTWLRRREGDAVSVIDDGEGTAIVDPLKLCEFLLEKCKAAGVQIYHPAVALDITKDVRNELASVRIGYTDSSSETEIPATRLLLAAGAWTPQVFKSLFPSSTMEIPVESLAGHSLVVRSIALAGASEEEHCWSVYCNFGELAPELYSRPNGVIYIAGVNNNLPLPDLATGSKAVESSLEKLKQVAEEFTVHKDDLEVIRSGLCLRPITTKGTPIIARLEDKQLGGCYSTRSGAEGGVFVAAGHGPWGISLSLGTGRVMAEMMQGREVSADISGLGL